MELNLKFRSTFSLIKHRDLVLTIIVSYSKSPDFKCWSRDKVTRKTFHGSYQFPMQNKGRFTKFVQYPSYHSTFYNLIYRRCK
jgi:hypothetical protein